MGSAPGARVLRLADQIKVIVADMLQRRIKDPRLGFVTITDVSLTGDTQAATVFYTVLGGEVEQNNTAAALKSATGILRAGVGKVLGLRHTPTLIFVLDALPETSAHIEDLLAKTRDADGAVAERAATASFAGEADPYRPNKSDGAATTAPQ